MSFSAMKKSRKKSLGKLVEESAKLNDSAFKTEDDGKFWKLAVDKAQNGSAVIRFLPAPEGEDVPWVRLFSHGFKDVGGWLIENCPTTIGKECPVCKRNNELWSEGENSNGRKTVSGHGNEAGSKRKLAYYSNIYVVKDPANKDNEGKVFLFRYGKKIFDALNDQMNPSFDDEDPVNPFDLWDGATFRLKARKVDGYRNYDKSTFDTPAPLLEDDDELEAIYKSEHPLSTYSDPDTFKSFDELAERLSKVTGNIGRPNLTVVDEEEVIEAPVAKAKKEPKAKTAESVDLDEDDEDTMSFFSKLADDD